jgi:hypothetical protein
MHVLKMLWGLGVYNMSQGMLCTLWNIHNMKGYESKRCSGITQFVLENLSVARGRLGENIAVLLLCWLHSNSLANLTFSRNSFGCSTLDTPVGKDLDKYMPFLAYMLLMCLELPHLCW